MSYPQGVPAVRAALVEYVLPAAPEGVPAEAWQGLNARLDLARMHQSVVPAVIIVLDQLGPHVAVLDRGGVALLAGAAELIVDHGFGGRAADARQARDQALARLTALPAPQA